MQIVNPRGEDYHMHSLNFSDGLATINELVQFAGFLGLKKIAITDHSRDATNKLGFNRKSIRKDGKMFTIMWK